MMEELKGVSGIEVQHAVMFSVLQCISNFPSIAFSVQAKVSAIYLLLSGMKLQPTAMEGKRLRYYES